MKKIFLLIALSFIVSSQSLYSQIQLKDGLREMDNKNYALAISIFKLFIKFNPDSVEAYFQIGNSFFGLEQHINALMYYDTAKAKGFDDKALYYNSGLVYLMRKDYPNALANFKSAHERDGNFKLAVNHIGDIYYIQDNYTNAREYYDLSLLIDPSDIKIVEKRANANTKLKNYKDALIDYTNLLREDSLNIRLINEMAVGYYFNQDTTSSFKFFRKSLNIDSTKGLTYMTLADIYAREERYDDALKVYDRVLEYNYKDVSQIEVYRKRSKINMSKGDYKNALNDIDMIISVMPNQADALLDRAEIFLIQDKDSIALKDIEIVIRRDTANGRAHMYKGIILKHKSKYEDALIELKKGQKFSPTNEQANYELGNLLFDMEKYAESISYYDKALKINPDLKYVYIDRGSAYYNLGFYRKAVEDFETAIKKDYSLREKVSTLLALAKAKGG